MPGGHPKRVHPTCSERDSTRGDAGQVPKLELEGSELVFGWESLCCAYVRGHETSRNMMQRERGKSSDGIG